MIRGFIAKHFYKSSVVRAVVIYPDRRQKTYWVVPEQATVQAGSGAYSINDVNFTLVKNIPTFYYDFDKPEPKALYGAPPSYMTADDYNTAISARVAHEIFLSAHPGFDAGVISVVLGVVSIVAIGLIAYLGNEKLTIMQETINQLNDYIKILLGVS